MGQVSQDGQFVGGVESTDLGGLGEANHLRLGVVNIRSLGNQPFYIGGVELPLIALGQQQFRAVAGELWGPALVGFHMGQFVADHAVVGLAQRRQGQGVGRRAVKDKEHLAVGLEDAAKGVRRPLGPPIVAVGGDIPLVGLDEVLQRLGAHARVVVAGKLNRSGGRWGSEHGNSRRRVF